VDHAFFGRCFAAFALVATRLSCSLICHFVISLFGLFFDQVMDGELYWAERLAALDAEIEQRQGVIVIVIVILESIMCHIFVCLQQSRALVREWRL
jgi:hypothetical protein